ncbi:unnamed protein product [Rhizopus stolonifer]
MSYPSQCYGEEAFHLTFEQDEPPYNILLKGDSGIGKSYITTLLAKQYNVTVYTAVLGELAANYQGYLSRGFKRLIWKATQSKTPSLVLIKDIDLFFGLLVLATTQRADQISVDVRALFDQEIHFEIPTPNERLSMMQHIYEQFTNQNLDPKDLEELASRAHGFTAADIMHWFQETEQEALLEKSSQVSRSHFIKTIYRIKVSGLDMVAEKPEVVYWKDIGGLTEAKKVLEESAVWIYKHADAYRRLGIRPSKGLLLYGPPGTGKTLLAKAVATESSANFLAVTIPDLIKSEVGESEKAVSRIFQTAIRCSPCVVFLDELEAIFASRETSGDVGKKLISQFLIEMDGLDKSNAGVIVLGATNYPDAMDEAILRPGRLDRLIYIGPPSVQERLEILKVLGQKTRLDSTVDLEKIAQLSEGCTGADLKAIVRKAGLIALKEKANVIRQEHIECALLI